MNNAPLKENLVFGMQAERSWLSWFGDLGDALKGKWFKRDWSFTDASTYTTRTAYLVYQGKMLFVQLTYTDLVGGDVPLPDNVIDGYLTAQVDGVLTSVNVENSEIILDGLSGGIVVICGSLILED